MSQINLGVGVSNNISMSLAVQDNINVSFSPVSLTKPAGDVGSVQFKVGDTTFGGGNVKLDAGGNLTGLQGFTTSNLTATGTLTVGGQTYLGSANNVHMTGGTNGYVLQTNGSGGLTWVQHTPPSSIAPGGANAQVQFNNAGVLSGAVNLGYNNSRGTVIVEDFEHIVKAANTYTSVEQFSGSSTVAKRAGFSVNAVRGTPTSPAPVKVDDRSYYDFGYISQYANGALSNNGITGGYSYGGGIRSTVKGNIAYPTSIVDGFQRSYVPSSVTIAGVSSTLNSGNIPLETHIAIDDDQVVRIGTGTDTNASVTVHQYLNSNAASPSYQFWRGRSYANGAIAPVTTNDSLGEIHWVAADASSTTGQQSEYSASIKTTVTAIDTSRASNQISSMMSFSVANNVSNTTPTMTFDSAGNLTIPGQLISSAGVPSFVYAGNTFATTRFGTQSAGVNSDFLAAGAQGTSGSPLATGIGDQVLSIKVAPYTGNGETTINGVSGYALHSVILTQQTALPAASGYRPATDTYIQSMGSANVAQAFKFGGDGNLTIPGNVVAAGANLGTISKFNEKVSSANVSGIVTPDLANGTIFKYTLTGTTTISSLANVVAGSSATIILQQDSVGGRTLTSDFLFAGGSKTLSTTANAKDIISVFYDGTTYYACLTKGFA